MITRAGAVAKTITVIGVNNTCLQLLDVSERAIPSFNCSNGAIHQSCTRIGAKLAKAQRVSQESARRVQQRYVANAPKQFH